MGQWLGLPEVQAGPVGDLAAGLAEELGRLQDYPLSGKREHRPGVSPVD
jgi:uncharacterized protein